MASAVAGYPLTFDVEPQLHDRDRLTSFFRIILAIPHLLLVGGPAFVFPGFSFSWAFGDDLIVSIGSFSNGVIGVVAGVVAFISWFAIVWNETGSP